MPLSHGSLHAVCRRKWATTTEMFFIHWALSVVRLIRKYFPKGSNHHARWNVYTFKSVDGLCGTKSVTDPARKGTPHELSQTRGVHRHVRLWTTMKKHLL